MDSTEARRIPSPPRWHPQQTQSSDPPVTAANLFPDHTSTSTNNPEQTVTRAPTLSFPFTSFSQPPPQENHPSPHPSEETNFDVPRYSQSPKRWTPRSRSPTPSQEISLVEKTTTNHNNAREETNYRNRETGSNVLFPFSSFSMAPPPTQGVSGTSSSRRDKRVEMEEIMVSGNGGAFLTWEDIWVTTAASGGRPTKEILHGVNGYARPGEVLAIMGPSGCGKSTLLDTLAGRLSSNLRQSGQILVNGQRQKLSFGTSAYVTQDDVLMTTLTVREAIYYSALLQLPSSMSRSAKHDRAEETIKEMGLRAVAEMRIGGWASKGLSGGEKRRVSICMEILTRPRLLFLDEPTSGLDSAASYHVMSRIGRLARREGMTVVAAIHQPSSEVFEVFHGLCLLAYGQTVWFGPPAASGEFFALNGFPCPPLKNPSDHYLRMVNKDFDADNEEGSDAQPTRTAEVIDTLVKSYKSSMASQQVSQQILEVRKKGGVLVQRSNQASFFTQSQVLIRRSFVNMYRDLGYYWLRFGIYIALCLCVGTIYHDIGYSFGSIQARGSMLMFVAAFLTFMAIGGFPSFVEDMKIFGRERLNGHYGVTAFVIGNTISSIPYLVLISVIPGAIAYYLVGLQRRIDHFAYFSLVLFMCMMVVEGLMMIVASMVPDFLMGIITGAGIQGVMILNGGFFRLPNDLPKPVWRYPMYYIAFHKYANQGFYKNEFIGLDFPNISGEEVLRDTWQVELGYSKWIDLAILFGMVIIYRIIFLVIIKITEKAKPKLSRMVKGTSHADRVLEKTV